MDAKKQNNKKIDITKKIAEFLASAITKDSVTAFVDRVHSGRQAQIDSYALFIATYHGLCKQFNIKENKVSWEKYLTPYLSELTGKAKGWSYPSMIAYKRLVDDPAKAKAWVEGSMTCQLTG